MAKDIPSPMRCKYRADHVGSLLRPSELLEARKNRAIAPEQLKELEDRHIQRVLQRQKDLGLGIFTDGEFRRQGFMSDFNESVVGLDNAEAIKRDWKIEGSGASALAGLKNRLPGVVVGKIRQKKRLTGHEAAFLKQHSPGDIKMTLPTPNQFPAIAYKKGLSDRAYGSYSEFLWDIVPIFKAEIQALAREGVPYIQIDAPRYSYYIDPKWRRYIEKEMGVDPEQALDEAIRADNACIEGARGDGSDALVAIHLCRGNNRSQWYAEGGYDPIAEKLFNELNVDAFLLEYESERAGTFEPLRFVPPGKTVVLGLVSTKLPEMETADQLMRRIDEASKYVPVEQLALSPQCGFASMLEGNLLTEEQQWRKLELVVETARRVWADA
jgi:5-methyltetrahydropteroyltriglutamate--homocysteine methyltransferase